jgi:signal transduction histidine kinase
MILSVFVFIIAVVWLTCIAGRSNRFDMTDSAEGSRSAGDKVTAEGSRSAGDKITAEGSRSAGTVCLTGFDKIKSELAAALVIGPWILLTVLVAENCWYYSSTVLIIPIISYAFLTTALFLIGYLSLVRRIKAHILWKESLLRMFCGWLRKAGSRVKEFWRQRRLLWKIVILYLGFILLHWIAIISFDSTNSWLILSIIVECVVGVIILRYAVDRDKITTGIKKIAGGEVEYKIPTEKLKGEALAEAERVNSIGEGMEVALEKSMKSERLKTDLITNVSHDIKTPLTSIINYVDLLKQENFEDPKIRRYIEVLEQKSQRLKTLTEDVVEASKVSSGNITLEYTKLNLVEMIQQTSGEFAEKFAARDLIEVMNFSEQEAVIRADGRRMWRVFSNIYNNVAKYAMPGTRVYADLVVEEARVKFDLKNISEQSLNISSDELTERFIRGDISRSTEGSGLGLSIAKTLTEMQGGTFEIYLDGDLFRVSITFPLAE